MNPDRRKPGLLGWALLCTLLIVATGAAVLAWLATDNERIRALVENIVSEATDRSFRIEGPFEVSYGRQIVVRASDVRWANTSWGEAAELMEIGHLELTIDAYSLLGGNVIIQDGEASDARLSFEWNEAEQFNWGFHPDDEPAQQPLNPLPLLLAKARLNNIEVQFSHPTLTDTLIIQVDRASHLADEQDRLVLDADLHLQDRAIHLTGAIGPFPQLAVAGAVDFDLNFSGPVGNLRTAGNFDWLLNLRNPDLMLSIKAPDTTALLKRLKLPEITEGSTALSITVDKDEDRISASANGQLGAFNIAGELRADSLTSYEGFQLKADASGPSIRKILSLAGIKVLTDHPFELHALGNETSDGIELQHFDFETRAMRLSANGRMRQTANARDITLQMQAEGTDIRDVAEFFDIKTGKAIAYELQAGIAGNGIGTPDILQATAKLGQIDGRIDGTLSERWDFRNSSFDYAIEAPDLRPLVSLFGLKLTEQVRTAMTGKARIDEQGIMIDELDAKIAATELTGNGMLYTGDRPESFDLQVTWSGENLAATLQRIEFIAALPMPAEPFRTDGRLQLRGNTLKISDTSSQIGSNNTHFDGSIDFSGEVPTINATLSADGDNLAELLSHPELIKVPAKPFSATAKLRTTLDALHLTDLKAELANGTLSGDFMASGEDYSRLTFNMAAAGPDISAIVPKQEVWQPAAVPFSLNLQGIFADDLIDLDKGEGTLGNANFEAQGEIEFEPAFIVREIQFDGSGPSLDVLGQIGDWDLPEQPFSIKTELSGAEEQGKFRGVTLQIGESNVVGNIQITNAERMHVDIDIDSDALNLDQFGLMDDTPQDNATSYFDDDALPFDFFDSFDGDLNIRLANLVTRKRKFREVNINAMLNNGHMKMEDASLASATGRLHASGQWKPHQNGKQIGFHLQAENAALALKEMSEEEARDLPHLSIDARMTASGTSTRELAASANGYVWVLGGEGKIRRVRLGAIWGDFATELINTVNPFAKKKEFNNLECQGFFFEVNDGTLKTSPLMVTQSDLVVVVARGSADLAKETLNFDFETTPRKGVGISLSDFVSPFTKVSGTFSEPKITLDPQGTAVKGSAAVVTGGLSIIAPSLWRRWISNRQICEKAGERALKERRKRDPTNVPDLEQMKANLN